MAEHCGPTPGLRAGSRCGICRDPHLHPLRAVSSGVPWKPSGGPKSLYSEAGVRRGRGEGSGSLVTILFRGKRCLRGQAA